MRAALALTLLAATVSGAWADETGDAKALGKVDFANSCAPEVQQSFERGVALLHSFAFAAGGAAFQDVLARDPGCAIATWGIATLLIGNTFALGPTPDDAKRAQEAIDRGRAIGAKTQRERDYVEAIAAYYNHFSERPHPVRMRSLADAFEALAARYPHDDEAQIFSGLYITATQPPADKALSRALKGAAILEAQFKTHPDHPGVAHYLIHSYDFPPIAAQGLPAAICYAEIAPGASHALHMPSHIFTRVGAWQESVATNTRSIASAKLENGTGQILHAMDYMVYADLQLGRDADAEAVASEAGHLTTPVMASFYARAAIPARVAIERGAWHDAASLPDSAPTKFPYTEAMTYFARAIGAARSGDPDAAQKDVTRLAAIVATLKAQDDPTSQYWATEVEVQRLGGAAWIAYAQGRHDEALGLMQSAADMEDASEKTAVSPGRIVPARELLGDMLLENGQPAEALKAYQESATLDPKRFRGLYGAGAAAAASGDTAAARNYYGRLVAMADPASPRAELAAARQYLAAK